MCCDADSHVMLYLSKVIETLLKHGNPKEMSDLVLVAAECMGELIVGTEVRHSSNSEFTVSFILLLSLDSDIRS